jgi:ClpP class serine protease
MVRGEFVQEVMRGLGAEASSEEAVAQAEVGDTEIAGDLILHYKLGTFKLMLVTYLGPLPRFR